ncbi:MAG: S8 family serine peptidase [Proteobacteria bacterium]|nr:S8 family serine peptidase [Pseudomonadota bacterium]
MRGRTLLVVSLLLAGLASPALAERVFHGLDRDSLKLDAVSVSPSVASHGALYGVRERNAAQGSERSLGIFNLGSPAFLTPGSCPDTAGWCDTAAHIAATTFGWDFHAKGAGVIIGIVDSGIDLNNPEFTGRILSGWCIVSSVNDCQSANDQVGGDLGVYPTNITHGTHVAGIAAGTNTGIAPLANILPVKVCQSFGTSCDGITQGISWAFSHGATIINVSIAGPVVTSADTSALKTIASKGGLLVVAAGNAGNTVAASGYLAGAALTDGIRGSMIVVGATGKGGVNGYGQIAYFSQIPSTTCQRSGRNTYCMRDYFVVAPGYDIWSSVGNGTSTSAAYGYLSGTSMASPYVAGVAAVIKGQWPNLTGAKIASIIFSTTDDVGPAGVDNTYGRGAVDITRAMAAVGTVTSAPNPSEPSSMTFMTVPVVSGPLSAGITNSTLMRDAILFDAFGRDFKTDLTKSVVNRGFDPIFALTESQFVSFSPFAFAIQSPVGQLTATGYASDKTTPALLSGELRTADHHQVDVHNLDLTANVAPGMELNLGLHTDMAGRFNAYDAGTSVAYDGLFLSASGVNSPYANLTGGGNYVGATIDLEDDLHLRLAETSLSRFSSDFEVPVFSYLAQIEGDRYGVDQRQAQSSVASLNWDFADWGGVGLVASQTSERNGVLGGLTSGLLAVADSADTSALGVSTRIGFGGGWVTTIAYSEGITKLNLKPGALFTQADALHSRSYGIAVAKHGLFDEGDSLGLAVSRPVQIFDGDAILRAVTGLDAAGAPNFQDEKVSLVSKSQQTDFELGYVTTFLDGALALQANAGYQMNLGGQEGQDSLSVLSRAKINF